jgi:hypothetical protein
MKSKLVDARLFVLVIAAAALLLAGCGGGDDGAAPAPGEPAPGETEPGEAPLDDDEVAGEEATMVELQEHEGSGYSGVAILTPAGDAVYVDVEARLEDEADDEAAEDAWEDDALYGLFAEIRSGSCADPGETVQPVAQLQFGWGAANVEMSLGELTGGDYVMVISRSETAAAQEAEDPFGEGDTAAPGEDDPTETVGDVTLADDRQMVACGPIEAGVAPEWEDDLTEDDDMGDDDMGDDDLGDDEDDG